MMKVIIFFTVLNVIGGCLITNCPTGGKRSFPPSSFYHRFRPTQPQDASVDCRRCGPNREGRCINQTICCGPKIGCLVGTPAILPECSDMPSVSVLPHGARTCSIGACLSDGVCCSTDGCKMDYSCEMESAVDMCNISPKASY